METSKKSKSSKDKGKGKKKEKSLKSKYLELDWKTLKEIAIEVGVSKKQIREFDEDEEELVDYLFDEYEESDLEELLEEYEDEIEDDDD